MKQYNHEYFNSLPIGAKKRYCCWLIEAPGYGFSIFEGMNRDLKAANDESLAEWQEAYPGEFDWFNKHIQKDPETLEIQTLLFKPNN